MTASSRIRGVVGGTAAVAAGIAVSFATTGPALFADGDFSERVAVLGVAVAAFATMGFLAGLASPARWRMLAWCLWAGSAPVALYFGALSLGEYTFTLLALGFLLGDLAAALFGAWAGGAVRERRAAR